MELPPQYHILQMRYGREVLASGSFRHGFLELTFDQQDSIFLNEDPHTRKVNSKAAEMLRKEWEGTEFAETQEMYVKVSCATSLHGLLDKGKDYLGRTGKDRNCPI